MQKQHDETYCNVVLAVTLAEDITWYQLGMQYVRGAPLVHTAAAESPHARQRLFCKTGRRSLHCIVRDSRPTGKLNEQRTPKNACMGL